MLLNKQIFILSKKIKYYKNTETIAKWLLIEVDTLKKDLYYVYNIFMNKK